MAQRKFSVKAPNIPLHVVSFALDVQELSIVEGALWVIRCQSFLNTVLYNTIFSWWITSRRWFNELMVIKEKWHRHGTLGGAISCEIVFAL